MDDVDIFEDGADASVCDTAFKERLIEEVRKYAHLYDAKNKDHHNNLVCANSWESIAIAVGRPGKCLKQEKNAAVFRHMFGNFCAVKDCKKTWTALRRQFYAILNKIRGKSGAGAKKPPRWQFFKILAFLRVFEGTKR